MKYLIVSLIFLISISFGSDTRYKTFTNEIEAIDFVALKYKLSADTLGGMAWWSSHKIIAIPVFTKPNGEVICKFIVYWMVNTNE